jgi:hypothetical protein
MGLFGLNGLLAGGGVHGNLQRQPKPKQMAALY